LNIIERKRRVEPYLGCYLRLADVDWHCILLDEPLSCHHVTRQDLIYLFVISLECLAILLQKVVPESLFFMIEVVNSPPLKSGAVVSFLHD
jgi:hypothetical protein